VTAVSTPVPITTIVAIRLLRMSRSGCVGASIGVCLYERGNVRQLL
jgi:hypothetical protein